MIIAIYRDGEEIMDLPISMKCRFCGFFSGEESESIDAPWLKHGAYCAIASKGAMVPGWSLVCPLKHGYSLSEHYKHAEFWDFTERAASLIGRRYGNVAIFEHGAGYAGSPTACGTDHAHMHLVPLEFSLTTEALRFNAELSWHKVSAAEISAFTQGREYLFTADKLNGIETIGLVCIPKKPISQFFRRVIATRIGLSEFFDYKSHPMLEIASCTAQNLRADAVAGDSVGRR